ncbi:MAG: 3-deoxy-7-phosphoheptulonate synthase [Ezakiella sp.]|nr:3-deoxy-7-phosphoheptulonate synthase [Ezakiella sp.]MDD7761699.1 3-deoxy-7-phosphoheptulonate synthase [Bacillota bacterium]MDY3946999.1 3-deoxy-7-phosphoheptulonate synthase [Ezakiella sp.]
MRLIAGSCSIENREQALSLAKKLKSRGITEFRAMIFKPRTDPESFQGIGYEGLSILDEIRSLGLKTVTEVMSELQIEKLYDHVDVFQVGSRNMQNFSLLKELGKTDKPIILKRGFASYVDEWLKASDYIVMGGNEDITLCERGIRSFDDITRNVLDIGAIIYLKQSTGFQVIADPSHSMGRRNMVIPASRAALAAGADGLIVEVHEDPDHAYSDGQETIDIDMFDELIEEIGFKE